jgi:hypothetical protein
MCNKNGILEQDFFEQRYIRKKVYSKKGIFEQKLEVSLKPLRISDKSNPTPLIEKSLQTRTGLGLKTSGSGRAQIGLEILWSCMII